MPHHRHDHQQVAEYRHYDDAAHDGRFDEQDEGVRPFQVGVFGEGGMGAAHVVRQVQFRHFGAFFLWFFPRWWDLFTLLTVCIVCSCACIFRTAVYSLMMIA